jgi:hypothetical protein
MERHAHVWLSETGARRCRPAELGGQMESGHPPVNCGAHELGAEMESGRLPVDCGAHLVRHSSRSQGLRVDRGRLWSGACGRSRTSTDAAVRLRRTRTFLALETTKASLSVKRTLQTTTPLLGSLSRPQAPRGDSLDQIVERKRQASCVEVGRPTADGAQWITYTDVTACAPAQDDIL